MKSFILIMFLFLSNFLYAEISKYPNETSMPHFCTSYDPHFLEHRYVSKTPVCKRSVSSSLKNKVYEEYGVPAEERINYTIDHIVPLFLGGSNHRLNLWPQHLSLNTSNREGELYREVNAGRIHPNEAFNLLLLIKYNK